MPSKPNPPAPPDDLDDAGRRLWEDVVATFYLDVVELQALRQACRLADRAEEMEEHLAAEGIVMRTSQGPTVSRLLTEVRQYRATVVTILRTLGAVGIKEAPETPAGRPRGRTR